MTPKAQAAVASLQQTLNDNVSTSTSLTYDKAVAAPWSQTCWTAPAAFVHTKTPKQLADALAIVRKENCPFAVRTTGHNPNPGFSSAGENGVVLDIRGLNSKELDGDVARVGAGCIWGELYPWLEEKGRSVVGGRDQSVGLAGFLLGGGLGALPNLHGIGADSVKGFEVLLADGTLVEANTDSRPDLYRALKGGGSNFGIVTRFDLETHPLIKVQWTINLYNPSDHTNINKATAQVQHAMENDSKIGLFTNFNQGFVAVGMLYADHSDEKHPPDVFKPFVNLESLMMNAAPTTNGTLLSLAQAMDHGSEDKKRYVGTLTTKVSEAVYEAAYKAWTEITPTLPEGGVLHYTIQPVGTSAVEAGEARGGNCLGLEKTPQCWWVFTCEWPKAHPDQAAQHAVNTMVARVRESARQEEQLLDFLFPSFASASQDVLASYGEEECKELKRVAARYDPEGVFQTLQIGGFLLREPTKQ